jgi:hypothetical protein
MPRRLVPVVVVSAMMLAACGQGSPPREATSAASTPTVDPGASGGTTPSAAPSSAQTTPPIATLPDGVPASFDADVAGRQLPVEELIPPGDEITSVARARTDLGEAVLLVFHTPGPDPFREARGFVVWRRDEGGEPPWRAVYGIAHGKRDGVLAISADVTDLTGDGSDDALVREETGGSGACATYRVIDLGAATSIWRRAVCDTEIQPNPDPLGLYLVSRVYEPGDSHCCPSAIRETLLAWRSGAFREVSRTVTPLAGP